jgi:hypothetical protein
MKAVLVACLCALLMMTTMMVVATSAQLFDVPADADQGAPCPGLYPRVICADCQLGCSYCGAYTGNQSPPPTQHPACSRVSS